MPKPAQSFDKLEPDQQRYLLQFRHPQKLVADLPGVEAMDMASLFGIDPGFYEEAKAVSRQRVGEAATALLADSNIAEQVAHLPFRPGDTVVALGDSITDDDQSWGYILAALLSQERGTDDITVINAGYSGDTTAQIIARFLVTVIARPNWVICLAGTNDARLHGQSPTKTLVSLNETGKNLAMLRNYAATQTRARWVWMTPPPVDETVIASHWFLSAGQMMWRNADLTLIADLIRRQPDPHVDLRAAFEGHPEWLLPDGLHPSLEGQKGITRALVAELVSPSSAWFSKHSSSRS